MTVLGTPLAVRLKSLRADAHVSAAVKGLRFRSTIPGGFASCEMQINRPLNLDPDEVQMFGDVIIYDGRHGGTVWQGRLEDTGRAAGPDGETWTLRATGPSAHARDRYAPLVYIESGWTSWEESASIYDRGGGDTREQLDRGGSGNPALHLQFPDGYSTLATFGHGREYRMLAELGLKLARIDYTWDAGLTSADYNLALSVGDSVAYAIYRQDNLNTAGGGSNGKVVVTHFFNGDDKCRIELLAAVNVTVGVDTIWASVMNLAVMAMLYDATGAEITTGYGNNYYTANQIVSDLLGRLLTKYDGANAAVAANSYQITQLSYPDAVTSDDVLADLMRLEPSYYWAAWEESPTVAGKYAFEWAAWPVSGGAPVIRYEARASDGLDSPASGQDIYNAVTVRWRDSIGKTRRTRRTATVAELDDAGLTKEALIDLGDEVGSSANAIQAGDQYLAEHKYAPNAGRLTVQRPIPDYTQARMVQPWEIRPGGHIRVLDVKPRIDSLNPVERDGVTIFRVTAVEYNAANNTATLELDSPPRTIEGLLRRSLTTPDKRRR